VALPSNGNGSGFRSVVLGAIVALTVASVTGIVGLVLKTTIDDSRIIEDVVIRQQVVIDRQQDHEKRLRDLEVRKKWGQ
jgi:hypothetical protein